MKSFTAAVIFSQLVLLVAAQDASGSANLGNGQGLQFITGVCASDADCASTCCASGLCSAVAVAAAKGGCGFVAPGTTPASTAPPALTAPVTTTSSDDAAGDENLGNGEGKQFITGVCDSDADCASACCASGLCSAVSVAPEKGGCGFVAPSVKARQSDASGSENLGNGEGKQFITGVCDDDADCASACCASGLCSAVAVAAAKGGCGFVAAGTSPISSAPLAVSAAPVTTSSTDNASGSENLGNGEGKQFITGVCDDDADCASACCASGLCSAVAVAAAKGGCGFVAAGTSPVAAAPVAVSPAAITTVATTTSAGDAAPGSQNVGTGNGLQFITGKCDSDADCASTCCASGLCSAIAVAPEKGGCGFVARKREFWA